MKTRNIRLFYSLLGRHARRSGVDPAELKTRFVRRISDGRTDEPHRLTDVEYAALIGAMEARLETKNRTDADRWRKRVMAAVGGWLGAVAEKENPTKIKAIACRAARCEKFNEIPLSKLRGIYNEFSRQRKAAERGRAIAVEILASDVLPDEQR